MTKQMNLGIPLFAAILIAALTVVPDSAGSPTYQTLITLKGVSNGGQPWATPIVDKSGNLYGTASEGGNGAACVFRGIAYGCGVVYKLSAPATGSQWIETLIYQFQGDADGKYPVGSLVFDAHGNLYGTTQYGGTSAAGTVFELSPPPSGSGPWTKTTIYNFPGGASGNSPVAGLIFDEAGNLYGTTSLGGTCNAEYCGVVFELSPPAAPGAEWTETVLYSFQGTPDGGLPESTLVLSDGKLYGTTEFGGLGDYCGISENCGIIFQLSPPSASGGTWTETILHSFSLTNDDGALPRSGLVLDSSGTLYGTTQSGGSYGLGSVYQLVPPASPTGAWSENVIYSFVYPLGEGPFGTPVIGGNGSLYGTTMAGGDREYGNVYQLTPPASPGDPWAETVLTDFNYVAYPFAGLTFGQDGWLYGATVGGDETDTCQSGLGQQSRGCGTLFRVHP